jgi:transposase InsO family protein
VEALDSLEHLRGQEHGGLVHCDYRTRDQARASLFDYMEVFYNRQRRHSTINYEAPLVFEAAHAVS